MADTSADDKAYLATHGVPFIVNDLVVKMCAERPSNPVTWMKDAVDTVDRERKAKDKVPTPNGQADIGLIGLAVMGMNLILNMNDKGFVVCAYNRTVSKVESFLQNEARGTRIIGATSMQDLCSKLKKPRKIMLLVRAGSAVDEFIDQLMPYLDTGDIVIDGGNSHFPDSIRRTKYCESQGILFCGCGVSGGEEGARHGPSLMPGGSAAAWQPLKPIFQAVCAKTSSGEPCCDWVGPDGSGHYVKMVHNGIEYGDMQTICEAYQLMRDGLGMSADEIARVFDEWNRTELDCFLIEITADILKFRDTDGTFLVDKIRDTAGQKGTGKWTAIESAELGVPVTLIGESVFARCLSSLKDERVHASRVLRGPDYRFRGNRTQFLDSIRQALYASKIVSYAQGYMLFREAAKTHGWGSLNYGGIALMWRGGCIIRSQFLGKIKEAFDKNPNLSNLLLDDFFKKVMDDCTPAWREVVAEAARMGIPVPTFSTAMSFYDGFRTANLPANLLQAQRDYFGAHTYELLSSPGQFHHTNWTGRGGNVSSTTYST